MKNNNKNINNEIWSFRWCRDGHVRVGPTLISPYQQHKTEFLCSQISRHLLKNIASLIRLGRTHHTLTNIHSLVRQFLPIGPQHHSRHLRPCHPWAHRSARHRTGFRSRIRRIERGLHNWIQRKRNVPRLGIIGPTLLAPQWSCWSFFAIPRLVREDEGAHPDVSLLRLPTPIGFASVPTPTSLGKLGSTH